MRERGLDALGCTVRSNVLLFSGYRPVIGTSIAIALSDGRIILIVPEDEQDLAARGWAAEVVTFLPDSPEHMTTAAQAIRDPLRKVAAGLGNGIRRLGREGFEADGTGLIRRYASLWRSTSSIAAVCLSLEQSDLRR